MNILSIISQNRRDFRAVYECEHCRAQHVGYGYDDTNFHQNVIPAMICKECSLTAGDTYRPLDTKYPDYQEV